MALTDNLISYWKLDESSGNASDSVGGNTLTNTNTATFVSGKINNAANFVAASTQYFTIADNAPLSTGDIDFTIACWIRLTDKSATYAGPNRWTSTGSQLEYILVYGNASDRFVFGVSNNGTAQVTVNADNLGSPSAGTWYFVVGWHDSVNDTINIQVNNGTVNSSAHTTGVIDGTGPFRIGADGAAGSPMNGDIDEVGFWKKVLTSDERTTLYNAGAGLTYPFDTGTSGFFFLSS